MEGAAHGHRAFSRRSHTHLREQENRRMKGLKVAIALMLLVTISAIASDTSNSAKSSHATVVKSWSLTLYHPTHVGATLLRAGAYNVQQVNEGGQEFLVFKKDRKEVARVPSTAQQLPHPTSDNTVTEHTNAAGEHVLTAVSFAGERWEHRLPDSLAQAR